MFIGVKSNNISVAIAAESAVGTKPATGWVKVPVNNVDPGTDISTVESTPLGSGRMHFKGSPTGLSSKLALDLDLTMHAIKQVVRRGIFAKPTAPYGTLAAGEPFRPTAVTSTDYTVPSGGALTQGTLIRARGFTTSGNNGVKKVGASSTGTAIKTTGLTAETSSGLTDGSQGATVEVCGVEAGSGDIVVASATRITSTTLDFTTLGWKPGMWVGVGDPDTTGCSFATSGNGPCRLSAVSAHQADFDITIPTLAADTGTGKTIRLLFGPWSRDVVDTDSDWRFQSDSAELRFPNLYAPNPGWEYPVGNYWDAIDVAIPVKSKGGVKASTIGTENAGPTDTEATGASAAATAIETVLFNTSSDVSALVTKDGATPVVSYWKQLTLKFKNNLKPLEVVGTFGAIDVNYGFMDVTIEGDGIYDSGAAITAIRNNDTCNWYAALGNTDGGVIFDIPSLTFGGGKRNPLRDEEVDVNLTGKAFKDATLGYQTSISTFPYWPSTY